MEELQRVAKHWFDKPGMEMRANSQPVFEVSAKHIPTY